MKLLILPLFLCSLAAQCQIWPLGKMQGIDFNSKIVKIVSTGINNDSTSVPIRLSEFFSSSISDCNGKPLFYTNGIDVWNKKDTIMDNGRLLLSCRGSYCAGKRNCLIIPIPNSTNLFYIFYMVNTGTDNAPNSLYFSLVDMAKNNGLGKVTFKDSIIDNKIIASTNLTYAKHTNDTDIWLITSQNDKKMCAFKITQSGLNINATVSNVDSKVATYRPNDLNNGYIKTTNNFDKIIISNISTITNPNSQVLSYDFNRYNGKLTNEETIIQQNEFPLEQIRNIAFSNNDSLIYFSIEPNNNYIGKNFSRILQYNIFTNKKIIVHSFKKPFPNAVSSALTSGMANGPDGKIYVFIINKIYTINFPNKRGRACKITYWDSLQYMNYGNFQKHNSLNIFSLPNIYMPERKLFFSASTDANPCTDTTTITYRGDSSFYKLVWYFGDGDSLVQTAPNIKTGMKIKHVYQQDGVYELRLKSFHAVCNRMKEYADSLLVKKTPLLKQFQKLQNHACYQDSLMLRITQQNAHQLRCQWGNFLADTVLLSAATVSVRHVYPSEKKQLLNFSLIANNGCKFNWKDSINSVFHPKPVSQIIVNKDTLLSLKIKEKEKVFSSCDPFNLTVKESNPEVVLLVLKQNQDSFVSQSKTIQVQNSHTSFGFNTQKKYITISYNQFNCFSTDTFISVVYPQPKAVFRLQKDSQCLKGNAFQFVNQSQYAGHPDSVAYSYFWNNVAKQSLKNSFADTGLQHFKAIINTELGCSDTAKQSFRILPHPKALLGFNNLAACLNQHLFKVLPSNAHLYTLLWGDGAQNNVQNQTTDHQYATAGKYDFMAIATDQNQCKDSVYQTLEVFAHPIADFLLSKDEICVNQQPFSVQTQTTYSDVNSLKNTLYFGSDEESQSGNFSYPYQFASVGTFAIQLVSETNKGCKDSISKNITIHPFTDFSFEMKDNLCLGELQEIALNWQNTNKMAFEIKQGSNIQTTEVALGKQTETINYIANQKGRFQTEIKSINENGCALTKDLEYTVFGLPTANFDFRKTESQAESTFFQLNDRSSAATEWNWRILLNGQLYESQAQNPEIKFTDTGRAKAYLFITDQNNCKDSTSKNLLVYPSFVFFFPEAISANNDGLNETFKVSSPFFIIQYELEIFNRWGQKIFETNNPSQAWQAELEGVYLYRVFIKDLDNKIKNQSGTITVLR